MTEHRAGRSYSRGRTLAWLSWLARRMEERGQAVFLLEQLDESWLTTRWQRLGNLVVMSGLLGALFGGLAFSSWQLAKILDNVHDPISVGLPFWLLAVPLWALGVEAVRLYRRRWLPSTRLRGRLGTVLDVAVSWAFWSLIWGMVWGFLLLRTAERHEVWLETQQWLTTGEGLVHPLLAGLLVAIFYRLRYGRRREEAARTVEALGWSWRSALFGILGGVAVAVAYWLVYLALRFRSYDFGDLLLSLGVYLALGGAVGFLLNGLRARQVVEKTRPNEGVRLSLRNAVFAGGLAALVLGPVGWGAFTLFVRPEYMTGTPERGAVWLAGLAASATALWFGGMDYLRHRVLRLFLPPHAPLLWIPFLAHAVRLRFLRRAGGGYMFLHRFLLQHFAAREVLWRDRREAETWQGPIGDDGVTADRLWQPRVESRFEE